MTTLKYISALVATVFVATLFSCSNDTIEAERQAKAISFKFSVDDLNSQTATRATISPVDGETNVNSLYLYFFNSSEDMSGTLAAIVPLTAATDGILSMETTYVINAAGISAGNAYHVVGVANMESYVDNVDEWNEDWTVGTTTEARFRDTALFELEGITNEGDYTTQQIEAGKLLMSGAVDVSSSDRSIQMVLTRNVARFDVSNAATTHTLKTISIWNAYGTSSATGDAILDYSSSAARVMRFYGMACDTDNQQGGLYAFENYSDTPAQQDKVTTSLIIGLENLAGATKYYRVNVCDDNDTQNLKRNYAYKINIITVTGEGYDTELEAWAGITCQLQYNVNQWNLDDNGLIVTDENSLLAVPVKTVKIGAEGGDFSYTITTFSTLADPAPLTIKSQNWEPTGVISAKLVGNNLVITASAMNTGEESRSGIITITYAGLETTVNVKQTPSNDIYLEVTLDEAWEQELPATANGTSEFVYVNASGAWTATMYGDDTFVFKNSLGSYVRTVSSADFTNSRFHIYTETANESKTDSKKGFAIITLDEDPDNYVAVVTIYQSSTGEIAIDPDGLSSITFTGAGKYIDPTTNAATTATSYIFKATSNATISTSNVKIVGANLARFTYTASAITGGIEVTVKPTGTNSTAENYTATLVVTDSKNAMYTINLIQTPLVLKVEYTGSQVPVTGGVSDPLTISYEDESATFTVSVATSGTNTSAGKSLINHNGEMVNSSDISLSTVAYADKDDVRVKFGKVYFPNREIPITATVTVTTDTGVSATCEVTQETLASKGVDKENICNMGATFGYLGDNTYFNGYSDAFSYPTVSTSASSYPTSSTTYAHIAGNIGSGYSWTNIVSWRNSVDGITFLVDDDSSWRTYFNKTGSPMYDNGYEIITYSGSTGQETSLTVANRDTRVGKFLTTQGGYTTISDATTIYFYRDGISTEAQERSGYSGTRTAIQVIKSPSGNAVMYIDPANGWIYLGECQVFQNAYLSNATYGAARTAFMNNFILYVKNAAKYGSHFMDMLIEGNTSVPEPWDTVWGDNAWPAYNN